MRQDELVQVKKQQARRLLDQYAGVVGVGVSEKTVEGKKTGQLALTVYVRHKLRAGAVVPEQRIDEDGPLLAMLSTRADLDIKQLPEIRALSQWGAVSPLSVEAAARRGIYRPVYTGASEGHFAITAGTGSVLVKQAGVTYRLSNNHVYANQNDANAGDPIYQPGPIDGGVSGNTVGRLHSFIPLSFNYTQVVNEVDAAIRTVDGEEYQDVIGLNAVPTHRGLAEIGMRAVKSGRTTEVRSGVVADVNASIFVGYGGGQQALFEDQIIVESPDTFSQGGDSGSAVFQELAELPWIGLLFAGDERGQVTICNHAHKVEELLVVNLWADGPAPEPPPPDDQPGCNPFRRGG